MAPVVLAILAALGGDAAETYDRWPSQKPPYTPGVLGSLDKDVIRRTVAASGPQVRLCYERAISSNPRFAGKLVVFWRIESDGSTAAAQVDENTLEPRNQKFEACVLDVIAGLKFPQPKGGGIVLVHYPFVFKQSDAGAVPSDPSRQSRKTTEQEPDVQGDPVETVTIALVGITAAAVVAVMITVAVIFSQGGR